MFPHPTPSQAPQIPLIDNVFAPEMLASGIAGLSIMNGIVTITLESVRYDHGKTPAGHERVVVARVALPVPAAQNLTVALHQFLAQHGLSPLATPAETRQ